MQDLISRQAAIDAFWKLEAELRPSAIDAVLDMLKNLPSAQPERKKGKWLWDEDTFDWEKEYICSECGCYALRKDGNQIRSNFCPNCGADMREDKIHVGG